MGTSASGYMIVTELSAFIVDRRSRRLSPLTIRFYREELGLLSRWLADRGVDTVEQITPDLLRRYLLYLEDDRRRSKGGIQAAWRAARAFLRWFENEYEPDGWKSPLSRVQPPRYSREPITGIGLDNVAKLLGVCDDSILGRRDAAIFLTLVDSGLRISELLALVVGDLNARTGQLMVRHGKGDKARVAFVSPKTLKAIARYLHMRGAVGADDPLFATRTGSRLTLAGAEHVLRLRGKQAGIDPGGWHNFRRTYAIEMLRDGTDVLTLSRLLGHSDTRLVSTYAKETNDDLRQSAEAHSPVRRMK